MPTRSQLHLVRVGRPPAGVPPVTSVLPDTASIAAAGAVGRTIATLSATGGTPPLTFFIANPAGLAMVIAGNLLNTAADPVGTAGSKLVAIKATDAFGATLTETLTVTVT